MPNCVNALKEWMGKARATIVYDSTVDEFTARCLFQKVKGRSNVAVVGFTTDGDVFGGYYCRAVTEQMKTVYDPTIFAFSFESRGRCATPQRFAVREWLNEKAYVKFYQKNTYGFVWFGVDDVGNFRLGNEKLESFCCDLSDAFEGLEDTTLSGQDTKYGTGPYHHCTRLVAVQLS